MFGRNSFLMYEIARACARFVKKFENLEYRIERNGEAWILQQTAHFGPQVIVDVGCNIGDWSACARKYNPAARILAFDIMPHTAEQTRARFASDPNTQVFDLGLGEQSGDIDIFYVKDKPEITSIYPPHNEETSFEKVTARIERASDFFSGQKIDQIDFLKIDVEGAEHLVLRGVCDLLAERRIRVVQFEYGLNSVETRFLLADYYDLLGEFGYGIGKLYRTGVAFKKYEPSDENFWGPNYIAVHQDDRELIDALSIRDFKSLEMKRARKKRAHSH